MKKYIKSILCGFLFFSPYFVFGEVTCSVDNYKALIVLDKNEISVNDKATININSQTEHSVKYEIEDKNIIKIDEMGNITPLKVGNTKINVLINFEDEIENKECSSTIDIKVLSNDSSLKTLNIEGFDISTYFKSDVFEYEVSVPYSYEEINIIAEANDSNAVITGIGKRYINEGENQYEIIVKAPDETTSTYKINLLRQEANSDTTLKSLFVEGYIISPTFNKDTYVYTLNVDKNIEDITIKAEGNNELASVLGTGKYKLATGDNKFDIKVIAENNTEQIYTINIFKNKGNSQLKNLLVEGHSFEEKFKNDIYTKAEALDDDQIEIIGNENLKPGENHIIIRVFNKDKGATTYKIIVNKLKDDMQPEKNNILLNILLIIFIVSVLIMFTLIVIFIKRNYKNKKKKIIRKRKNR